MMLHHLGEGKAAGCIQAALEKVFTVRRLFTPDLGGACTTREFAEAVIREMDGLS
jgi:isocitrate/isopropylmalate dehydrogenase